MATKKTQSEVIKAKPVDLDQIASEVEEYKQNLINMMFNAGIDPTDYDYAIRICAETLRERDRVYKDYLRQVEARTTMCAWNSQARASLSMLKLTPWREFDNDDD